MQHIVMGFLSNITRRYLTLERPAAGKRNARAYAIGDIHGRLDLLEEMLGLIEQDQAGVAPRETFVVFLGDLIDRGPDSAGVIERLRTYSLPGARMVFLGGNHEEVLLGVLSAQPGLLQNWLKFGGAECAASYGVDPASLKRATDQRGAELLKAALPLKHVEFIAGMGDTFRFGDYLFVHAGIRPGVALAEQSRRDLRWIREPFLSDNSSDHAMTVVHGHTISDEIEERANRIGIDTGAVYSGRLTTLVVEDEGRRYMTTRRS